MSLRQFLHVRFLTLSQLGFLPGFVADVLNQILSQFSNSTDGLFIGTHLANIRLIINVPLELLEQRLKNQFVNEKN